jgi:glucosamine-6-phosphate deaminase
MIKFIIKKDAKEVGLAAAEIIKDVISKKPNAVLGLATGSSPLTTYSALIDMNKSGEISFKSVKTVNLDEYVGLDGTHDQSYRYFMNENLFNHIDIDKNNTNLPNGKAADLKAECERYDAVIESMGGVDVQVLGIGHNGHIGFNEPADSFTKGTGHIALTDSTIDANARFFKSRSEVPTSALSMGVAQIMNAKKIILIAVGEGKADIICKAFTGPITPSVPASALQLFAGEVYVVLDTAAASKI